MRLGLDEYEAMDSWLAGCWFRCLLAEAYAKVGMRDAALRALDGALATARRTGDHSYLAEVYRLQGEITLSDGDPASVQEAEDLFGLSLEIARKQGALSWELRTAVSLARLSLEAGKREHARLLLLPIVGKFSEGFYTPDLKQAMQLVNELGSDAPVRERADP
jgi:predicted ATPase